MTSAVVRSYPEQSLFTGKEPYANATKSLLCRGCTIAARHIPGQHNDLADDLSRNKADIFLSKKSDAFLIRANIPVSLLQ